MNITVGEKIEELIEKEEMDDFGVEGKHRVLSQTEREFSLAYCNQNFSAKNPDKIEEFA